MALREILKVDTSALHQRTLEQAQTPANVVPEEQKFESDVSSKTEATLPASADSTQDESKKEPLESTPEDEVSAANVEATQDEEPAVKKPKLD